MSKTTRSVPTSEVTAKDADRLIASYAQPVNPETKAALLTKLVNERSAYEKSASRVVPEKARPEHER